MVDESLPIVRYEARPAAHLLGHCDCACAGSPAPCDCACTGDPTSRSLTSPDEQTRLASVPAQSVDMEAGWRAYFNPLGPVGVAALNPAAQDVLLAFDQPALPAQVVTRLAAQSRQGKTDLPAQAVQKTIAELALIGLLRPAGAPRPPAARSSTLSAWLHITDTCNLACPYCYAPKSPGTMAAATGRAAIDGLLRMARQHGHDTLRIKYAGGEPTLQFGRVQELHAFARAQAGQAGVALEEVLLTNGVAVDDSILDTLAQEGMRLMVSLDGGPTSHDRLRRGPEGSTFGAVVDLLDRAVARGLRPDVSITLTSRNLDGVVEAVDVAIRRSLAFNLNFYRECAPARASQQPGGAALAPSLGHMAAAILDVFDLLQQRPAYPLPLAGILDRARLDLPHARACAAGHDYLVVGVNGGVSACQMIGGSPWSSLAAADPLAEVRQLGRELFLAVDERPACAACPWQMACGGGCPLLHGGDLHDRYCRLYRSLLPDLLRLEGRRLAASRS